MLRLELSWNRDRSNEQSFGHLPTRKVDKVLRSFTRVVKELLDEGDADVKALFTEPGEPISRTRLADFRNQCGERLWAQGPNQVRDGLSLSCMHNDSRWGLLQQADVLDCLPRNLILLDALDFMVAAMGPEDSLRVVVTTEIPEQQP